MAHLKSFALKKFGYQELPPIPDTAFSFDPFSDFIKILYLPAGSLLTVDFMDYRLEKNALFFLNPGQFYRIDQSKDGLLLYYNRDFYCVEIHDQEVACDGILFHNVYEIPVIQLESPDADTIRTIFVQMETELSAEEHSMEEMLRILLKQLIIRATRIWKKTHRVIAEEVNQEIEFSRRFSQLVEKHFTQYHTVADYASLLHISPKALGKKLSRQSSASPNEIIKERIMLEAKRLLAHTTLSVKEIAYKLGYEEPSYFIRLFSTQNQVAPQAFREQYRHAEKPQ